MLVTLLGWEVEDERVKLYHVCCVFYIGSVASRLPLFMVIPESCSPMYLSHSLGTDSSLNFSFSCFSCVNVSLCMHASFYVSRGWRAPPAVFACPFVCRGLTILWLHTGYDASVHTQWCVFSLVECPTCGACLVFVIFCIFCLILFAYVV